MPVGKPTPGIGFFFKYIEYYFYALRQTISEPLQEIAVVGRVSGQDSKTHGLGAIQEVTKQR